MPDPSILNGGLNKRTGPYLIFKTRHNIFQNISVQFAEIIVSVQVRVGSKHVIFQYYLN